jgi:hypothetical protein
MMTVSEMIVRVPLGTPNDGTLSMAVDRSFNSDCVLCVHLRFKSFRKRNLIAAR